MSKTETFKHDLKAISDDIRAERNRLNITQAELSKIANIGLNTIINLERGKCVNIKHILTICEILNLRLISIKI